MSSETRGELHTVDCHTRCNSLAGAASPQAVKKLLSLSEQSKPRHKPHPGAEPGAGQDKVDRADQPTPVNLTSESSSVSASAGRPKDKPVSSVAGKVRPRKAPHSLGSAASTDSGYGQGLERLERTHSESPQLPPRRRYHQHYPRQQPHGNSREWWEVCMQGAR